MTEPVKSSANERVSRTTRAAHDIRAPLHTVVATTELLRRTELDSDQRKYVDALRSATALLIRIVDDLLQLPGEATPPMARAQPFSTRELLEQVAEIVASRAHQAGLTVAAVLAPDLPAVVVGDEPRIAQILTNLASNAVKYTTQGEVILRASRAARPSWVRFEVQDSGPGIPPEQLEAIFQPYTQLDASNRAGGVGLGLPICRDLARRLGGDILVESVVGSGSTFTLELPLDEATDPSPGPVLPFDVGRLRFLCVGLAGATAASVRSSLAAWAPQIVEVEQLDQGTDLDGFDVVLVHEQRLPTTVEWAALPRLPTLIVLRAPGRPGSPVDGSALKVPHTTLIEPVRAVELHRGLADALKLRRRTLLSTGMMSPLPDLSGLRVLVVDDDSANLAYARLALEAGGARVETESSGAAVLGRVTAQDDLAGVLLDLEMPGASGFDVIAQLRQAELGTGRRIPIIVLSAHTGAPIDRAYALGATSHLTKPATPEEMAGALATFARRATPPGIAAGVLHARVQEAHMALVRRDFRTLTLVLGAIPPQLGLDPAALREALQRKDIAALQQLLNAVAPAPPAAAGTPAPPPPDAKAKRPGLPTTGLRSEFTAALREHLEDALQLIPPVGSERQLALRAIAHRVSGSARMFGFPELGEHARHLDQLLRRDGTSAEVLAEAATTFVTALRRAAASEGR